MVLHVLYDGDCQLCIRGVDRIRAHVPVHSVNIRAEGALGPYPSITQEAAVSRMHVVTEDGVIFSGAEAIAEIFRRSPKTRWLAALLRLPWVRPMAARFYDWVARRRFQFWGKVPTCDAGTCTLEK